MRKYYDYHFDNNETWEMWFEGETTKDCEEQAFQYQFDPSFPSMEGEYLGFTGKGGKLCE